MILSELLLTAVLVGCVSQQANESGDQEIKETLKEIAEAFEKENPKIQVELHFPGRAYENILKVKMAAIWGGEAFLNNIAITAVSVLLIVILGARAADPLARFPTRLNIYSCIRCLSPA